MTKETVLRAVKDAEEFIRRAKAVIGNTAQPSTDSNFWCGTKETSALRRTSMDLTRSLAEMRKRGDNI